MPNTKVKDQPKRLWKSLLRSLTPSSRSSKDSTPQPISRTIKFSESVARLNYIVDDLKSKTSSAEARNQSSPDSAKPDVPADAIVFGIRSDAGLTPTGGKARPQRPKQSRTEVHKSPQSNKGNQAASLTGAKKAGPSAEANPFVPLRDLFDLQRRTKQLLNSFVLADARLPESPVWAMSKRLLPEEPLADGELLYFEDDFEIMDSGMITSTENGKTNHNLLMKRQMYKLGPETPSFQLFSQVVVTNLTKYDGVEDPDECVWLTIAAKELKVLLDREGRDTGGLPEIPDSWERYLVQGLEALLAFHELFFMLEHPRRTNKGLEMTHVSARFLKTEKPYLKELKRKLDGDTFDVKKLMDKKERFFFDARSGTGESQQLVCCVPLFGPEIACWMCFLVSGPVFERSAGFI